MKMLTAEITKLLDKLYNLRGEDSVILTEMEKEKTRAEETKERTAGEKTRLQDTIAKLTEEERVLAEEGEKLVSTLSRIKTDDFKIVLEKLNVDFNPDKISEEVNRMLPVTINKVREEKNSAESGLVKVEAEMNGAIATIEELAIRKDEALSNQARLNEYFELALNGNINITRDSITSLLEKFDFSEDERREAAKIMMFPEDALFEYDKNTSNGLVTESSVVDVFLAKDYLAEEVENIEENTLSPKDSLIDLLKSLGFDHLDFTSNDIEKILANYNESQLRKNVEFAKSKGLKLDIFVDNIELLYDKELEAKVSVLLELGKDAFDIYLNPNILIKYNINDLNSTIDRLKESGLDPKKVPLLAY